MDRARRLAAAKQVDQPGESGVDAGRHRQASQHQNRQRDDDGKVGQLLQHVIVQSGVAFRKM